MYIILAVVFVIPALAGWLLKSRLGVGPVWMLTAASACLVTGCLLNLSTNIFYFLPGAGFLTVGTILAFLVFLEFGVLQFVGLFRLGALTRITYYEGLLQPLTLILLVCGVLAIFMFAFMPFFTINEDSKMYRDVAVSLVFLFTLPVMIYSSTKVIDEDIENRTMLILMSKPIARWQVVLGKYLGVLLLCFAMIVSMGIVAGVCGHFRYYDDMRLDYYVATGAQRLQLDIDNVKAMLALEPALLLQFLQIATLAAVSVAVSTRWGLAVNVTTVILLYIAANLARYAVNFNLPGPLNGLAMIIAHLLPGLGYLDLNQRLIYGQFNYKLGDQVAGLPTYGQIWEYTCMAGVYAVLYITAALSFGVAAFRTRELV
ncbi:MAG TPA: ABC transporter permease subunit [Phycisphaerae bacterium]|nr:ABC transporter permease subunit [Phycisphaerae bacterium]